MKWMQGRTLVEVAGGIVGMLLMTSTASGGLRKDHPYRHSVVDMPVSLAIGTVRTPEFAPATHWYWIMLQVEKPFPFKQMQCMMGVTANPLESRDCRIEDPLLRANWKVFSDGEVVKSGSSTVEAAAKYTNRNIFKFLGSFPALSGKKYVVEVSFTKDGIPLNVANPHLIVIQQGEE